MARVAIIALMPVLINLRIWQFDRRLEHIKMKFTGEDNSDWCRHSYNRVRMLCQKSSCCKARNVSRDLFLGYCRLQDLRGDLCVVPRSDRRHQDLLFFGEPIQQ